MKITFFSSLLQREKQIGLCIEIASGTDVGLKRKRNEDNLLCLSGEESPTSVDAVLVVADGIGGHVDGDVASQMAVDAVGRLIVERLSDQEPHSDEWPEFADTQGSAPQTAGGANGNHVHHGRGKFWDCLYSPCW